MTPLVMAVVAVNVAAFLVEETNFTSIVIRFGLWPARTGQQPYRLLTAAFLHANFTHILLNMITLIIIGPAVEAAIGRTRFVAVYLLAAVGGNLLDYLIGPVNTLGVGASGAIFGLMGTYLVLARRRRWDTSVVGILILVNLVFSFADPGIDWQAHVGGLAVGALLGWVFGLTERRAGPAVAIDALACAAVFVGLAVLTLVPPGQVSL
ncbi:MAG TPA: rhomboid family intramembrane serine protease [Acidimicrobiales bacterium]|nr:rhomboid family intramembrane serine protease [Acidimicrobiales bacterium]